MVKLQLSKEFLKTLPHIPSQKTRLRRLAAERAAAAAAAANGNSQKQGLPAVDGQDKSTLSSFKINQGIKSDSTAGLTMNTVTAFLLDKTGKPCRKWVKQPRKFRTFTGYTVVVLDYGTDSKTPPPDGIQVKPDTDTLDDGFDDATATPELLSEA